MFDFVIVGAGFTGATLAERIASQTGRRVLVIEQRNHVGGNAHDGVNAAGHLIHTYGPHIFHTNSQMVWDYLSRFTEWRPYVHRVEAMIDGRLVKLPVNLDTIAALFPGPDGTRYLAKLAERFAPGERVPVLTLRADADPDLRTLGQQVYAKVFESYTLKQWALRPEELSPSVTARVPVNISRDDRYFADRHQAMPAEGYTALFQRMLAHPAITLCLNTNWKAVASSFQGLPVIFTGPIDDYFDYAHGPLPYRSIRLEFETLPQDRFQPVAVVNYPLTESFTRITEFKHLTGQICAGTTVAREYPMAHVPGETEPYYPIPRDETQDLLNRYLANASATPDVYFCGRLGDYRYYNMDQAVAAALTLFERKIKPRLLG